MEIVRSISSAGREPAAQNGNTRVGMTDDAQQDTALDWSSASVDDGRLTVPVIGDVPTGWTKRVKRIVERLDHSGSSWGAVSVTKTRVRVDAVAAGAANDLHHFLESVVLQANADLREEDEDDTDEVRSDEDQQLTDAFRSLAPERPDG
jgi:hypothetical protein